MKEYAFFWIKGVLKKVIFSEIIYVQSAEDYLHIYFEKDRFITIHMRLHVMENFLPKYFLRVHRCFIVNKEKITYIEGQSMYFNNEFIGVTCSEKYRNDLLREVNYIAGTGSIHRKNIPFRKTKTEDAGT